MPENFSSPPQDEQSLAPDPMVSDLTPREMAELDLKARESADVDLKLRDADADKDADKNADDDEDAATPLVEDRMELVPAKDRIRVDSEYEGQSYDDLEDDAAPEVEEEHTMTVVEHLAELRDRLVRALMYIVIAFGVSLYFGKDIMRILQAPAGDMKFQALSIEEPLLVYIKVAFYAALVLASPFLLYEVSRFIGPGLTAREKRIVSPALVGGPLLFVCGAAFAYYLLLPSMLHFFSAFSSGVAPIHQRLDFYYSLVSTILLYMGLAFQLPIVIFALSFTGLVNSSHLIKFWRYAVFGASVVALVITPDPTAFSMFLVMGALITLYAGSVLVLKIFGR